MISVLIVDDNKEKVHKILEVLNRISGITEENIDIVPDIISAQKALVKSHYDLVLLDVMLPKRFNEMPKPDGGIQFLKILKSGTKYIKPLYIVGLTAYDETFTKAMPAFADSLWGIIKYEENSDKWERQVTEKIESIIEIKKERYTLSTEQSGEYLCDLAIVCALNKTELQSILNLTEKWEQRTLENDSTIYHLGTFKGQTKDISVVAAAAPQMGMTAASVLTMKLIQNFRPQYLIMTGIAAGVQGKVGLGDILVADPSWDYGAGKLSSTNGRSSFLPDSKQLRISPEIQGKLELLSLDRKFLDRLYSEYPKDEGKPDKPLSLYIGPVASGSAVVSDVKIVEDIIAHNRNLIGLEMETYGVYYAAAHCTMPRPTTFSIKSVCDFANSDKNDQFHEYAAYTSSQLMYQFVTNNLSFSSKSDRLKLLSSKENIVI